MPLQALLSSSCGGLQPSALEGKKFQKNDAIIVRLKIVSRQEIKD